MALKHMATWNHRVIEHRELDGTPYWAVHEVHYDEQKRPAAYTEHAANLLSDEGLDGLRWQLNHMLKALEAEVLQESDFVGDINEI